MLRNYFLFILLALLWSFSFLGIKICVESLPPVFSAMMRVLVAFLMLSVVFYVKNKSQKIFFIPIGQSGILWLTGLFTQALPFGLLFYGEKFITPGLASILNSTVSIWALLIGGIFFRDFSQWTLSKIIGLLLGILGLILVFLPPLHFNVLLHPDNYSNYNHNNLTGIICVTLMAVCYAIGGLITQHYIFAKTKTSLETNLWHQHLGSVICLMIASAGFETPPVLTALIQPKIILAILYLGIFSTALAWMIYFYLIKHWGTVRATSVMYVVPILAIFWDYLFLHIIPTLNECAGIIIILTGVSLIQYQKSINRHR